jgi:23S rRNA pseudouridine2605 synthase
MSETRLQKYLAEAGVASRRKSEELILKGRVSVNGVTIKELGTKVGDDDSVMVDGKTVKREEKKVYILLNKPAG